MTARKIKTPTMEDLGEKAFVRHLLAELDTDTRLLTGHGQDASVIALAPDTPRLAFKIDRAATPVSFSHGWSDSTAWGRMAVTANCSDLLAAGSIPLAFMLAVTVPRDWPAGRVEKIVLAAQEECRHRDVIFAGGDTKEGPTPQVVGSAIGTYSPGMRPIARNTARPGQALVITGEVGGFLGAFLQLANRPGADEARRLEWISYLAHPTASWDGGSFARDNLEPSAGVDTSDGIYDGLVELTGTGVGVEVDLDRVPFHPFARQCAKELRIPLRNFLFGAGDWNILFAVAGEKLALLQGGRATTRIGMFADEPVIHAWEQGRLFEMSGPRNEHFRKRLEDGREFAEYVANSSWFKPLT
jgi:thiamine-monophosphate kinase